MESQPLGEGAEASVKKSPAGLHCETMFPTFSSDNKKGGKWSPCRDPGGQESSSPPKDRPIVIEHTGPHHGASAGLASAVSQVLAERPREEMGLSLEEVKRSHMVSFLLLAHTCPPLSVPWSF